MKKVTHPIYKDYPNQPYISFERDLNEWENYPEKYPYGIVAKQQMVLLEEGLYPGDIVMLWRINFNNITTETIMPQYFEYRYGIDPQESIQRLIDKGYCQLSDAKGSLDLLSVPVLKRILKNNYLAVTGKKADLLDRINVALTEDVLEEQFTLRRYLINDTGKKLLNKYDHIIQQHGPKL